VVGRWPLPGSFLRPVAVAVAVIVLIALVVAGQAESHGARRATRAGVAPGAAYAARAAACSCIQGRNDSSADELFIALFLFCADLAGAGWPV
jgi:hypothetical protein